MLKIVLIIGILRCYVKSFVLVYFFLYGLVFVFLHVKFNGSIVEHNLKMSNLKYYYLYAFFVYRLTGMICVYLNVIVILLYADFKCCIFVQYQEKTKLFVQKLQIFLFFRSVWCKIQNYKFYSSMMLLKKIS